LISDSLKLANTFHGLHAFASLRFLAGNFAGMRLRYSVLAFGVAVSGCKLIAK
jgi:hypothetical protein